MELNLTPRGGRVELTNVDVAALRGIGWSTVPQINTQPRDFDSNGALDAADNIPFGKGRASSTHGTWRANFGESPAPAMRADSSHVLEPTAFAILATTALTVIIIRFQTARRRFQLQLSLDVRPRSHGRGEATFHLC